MRHLVVLDKIKHELEKDNNVLALLVFGSVASKTHHKKSDIDLSIIYKNFEPEFKFSTDMVEGIKIGYSRWSLNQLHERASISPYTMYVFAHAQLLFDKDSIKSIQTSLIEYFDTHPDVHKTWQELNKAYQKEKEMFGEGKTNIFGVYEELHKKYTDQI